MDLNDTIDDEDALCIPSLDNIQPYQFEPMAEMSSNATEMSEISDHSDGFEDVHANHEEKESRDIRLDNLAWCDCGNCTLMPIEDECICCQEVGPASEKMDDAHLQCITDHEGFIGNCLNRHVIEVSLYEFVERDGPIDDNEPINELYRYIAYRRFTRWIWQHLGKGRRKVIPACAVTKIRNAFPSENFTGFKYARP